MISSPATARKVVLISLVALLGMAAYRGKLSTTNDSFVHRLWGVGVLGTFLSVLADVAPSLAGPFAVLVALGYATSGGDKAISNFLGKISGPVAGSTTYTGPVQLSGSGATQKPSGVGAPGSTTTTGG